MRALALGSALLLGLLGCRSPEPKPPAPGPFGDPGRSGPAPLVAGTTLDARTGKPLAGVRVVGPGGVEAVSDAQGRFLLRGLAPGVSGELVATAPSGLQARNRLRGLVGGTLEVVLRLR